MKIKISPSNPEPHFVAVEIDTLTNDDPTQAVVEAAMNVVIASGHNINNVIESANTWAEEQESRLKITQNDKADDPPY